MILLDACSAGRKKLRVLVLPGLLALCSLMACARAPADVEIAVQGSTFWPVPVATSKSLVRPVGDDGHAWVVKPDGVQWVDGEGRRTHEMGSWLVAGGQLSELFPMDQAGRAWVIAHSPKREGAPAKTHLYLVEAKDNHIDGRLVLEADRIVHVREQVSHSPFDVYVDSRPLEDRETHAHLWIVYTLAGSDMLGVSTPAGEVEPVSSFERLSAEAGLDVDSWQVVPVGDGSAAWLKTDWHLFFVDAGVESPVRGPLLETHEGYWMIPGASGTRAWVMAEIEPRRGRRLYAVNAMAAPGTRPFRVWDEAMRQVVPAADGTRLWVAGSIAPELGGSGGVHLIDSQGTRLLPGGPLFPGQRALIAMTRSGKVWILTRSGSVALVDGNGRIVAERADLLPLAEGVEGSFEAIVTYPIGTRDDLLVWSNQVFHFRADGASVRMTPLLGGSGVSSLHVAPDGMGIWLQSKDDGNLYFISLREEEPDFRPHFVVKAMTVEQIFPMGDGGHGWIQATPASFAYVPLSDVGATLTFKGGRLKVERGQLVRIEGTLDLRDPLRGADAEGVTLDWPGFAHAAEVGGRLEVIIREPNEPRNPVASITRSFGKDAPSPRIIWYPSELSFGVRTYDILFRYQDDVGTNTQLVLHGVPFHAPLVEQVWFRTAVACVLATLFFLLPMAVLARTRLARRWLPFVSWLVSVVGGSGMALSNLARDLRIHFPSFVSVLLAEMILCLVTGAFSPAMFRLLASTKPFQWLVPLALELSATRRRVFRDYVAHVRHKLEVWRRQANDERFVSLPAKFQEFSSGSSHQMFATVEERLLHVLMHPDPGQRGNVLIESPGGRGKSALLREVVRLMLIAFEEDPSRPLPVLCATGAESLEDATLGALEANPLPVELHKALLLRGNYVLVVDGLTESSLTPEALQGFIHGQYGEAVRLLLTSRPHLGFRHAIESSPRWLHVEPERLDEQTLGLFISAYAPEGNAGLSEELEQACREPGGTYLPILVRLALLLDGRSGMSTVAELYDEAFRALLRRQGGIAGQEDVELLAWAGEFCLRTYWANGIRSLRYRNAPEQERMRKLLNAGVLVADDVNPRPGQVPSQVRFFHDSMQSYLTARGLFMREHAAATWDLLWRTAADPLFATAQSEFVSGAGSELFQLCLQVFGPEEKLRRELTRQLLEWARLHDDALTKRAILDALPEEVLPRFRLRVPSSAELPPGGLLRLATEACEANLRDLGSFYVRIAQLVWPLKKPEQVSSA